MFFPNDAVRLAALSESVGCWVAMRAARMLIGNLQFRVVPTLSCAKVLLSNVVAVCKVYNSSHLELIIKDLGKYVNDFNAKLVIIDSIISLHRAEFAGRGTLADRQQRLNGLLHKVIRLAEIFNIAVVITNQVQSSPDTFFGDPTKAAGGNVIGHASTYRIYLRKSGENRTAKMIDSPYHPYSDAKFTLNEKGTDDLEDELSSSSPKKRSTSNKRAMDKEMED